MKKIQSSDRLIQQFQTNVSEVLEPVEQNPLYKGIILSNISLTAGITNVIPTKIDRVLTGWFITRMRSSAIVYDTQDTNISPSQNLQLITSADVVVDLYVF